MKEFVQFVLSNINKFTHVRLTSRNEINIQNVVLKTLKLKDMGELRDKFEGVAFYNKFSRKILGMLAVEKLLKIKLVDYSKLSPKNFEAKMLVDEKEIEIVTFDNGKFPVINKLNCEPAIIVFKKDSKNLYICGYADKNTLNKYQNDKLFNGNIVGSEKEKSAFTGFDFLKEFRTLDELKMLINN